MTQGARSCGHKKGRLEVRLGLSGAKGKGTASVRGGQQRHTWLLQLRQSYPGSQALRSGVDGRDVNGDEGKKRETAEYGSGAGPGLKTTAQRSQEGGRAIFDGLGSDLDTRRSAREDGLDWQTDRREISSLLWPEGRARGSSPSRSLLALPVTKTARKQYRRSASEYSASV